MSDHTPTGTISAAELIEAVREFVETDVVPQLEGAASFHARVARNVLGIVERELELGPAIDEAHRGRLAALGVSDDAELATAVRSGAYDDRWDELVAALSARAADRLSVDNPRWLA